MILALVLSIFTFFLGRFLGRRCRGRDDKHHLSTAEVANHYYSKGYSAAIKELGIERRKKQIPQIVGGIDKEGRS